MNTNILDYMYEGYGYDMDNPLLYVDTENYNSALDADGYSDQGMKTFTSKDINIIGHEVGIDVVGANDFNELGQFISENGANYTDLRQGNCACKQ